MTTNTEEKMPEPTSGLGWKWFPETRTVHLLFEVDGLGEDENGTPCCAGVAMKIHLRDDAPTPEAEQCAVSVARYEKNGLGIPGFEHAKCTPVTWEQFQERGYDED